MHAVHEVVLVANSATARWPPTCGRWCAFNVSVIVEQNGRREQGYAGAGGRYSLVELVERRSTR